MTERITKIRGRARTIVYNVVKYFEDEKCNRRSKFSFAQVNKKAAAATGVSERTINQIRKEGRTAEASSSKIKTPIKKKRSKNIFLDNFALVALKGIITSIYTVRKEVPILKKILAAARQDLEYTGSISTLRKILIEALGYRFKKCRQNRSVLLERPNIRSWRAKYLRAIRANDELGANKKPVIYLDETWIHAHYTVKKCWQGESSKEGVFKNDSPGRRWVLVHAGGETGFVEGASLLFKSKTKSGDYHDEMNGDNFKKWINEKLIPNLKEPSIIVMDNASYHSVQSERLPTMATKKADMQNWLQGRGIPFDEGMFKPELYMLIKENAPQKRYEIDEIFQNHGHQVLRLPPYNCELSPIEFIWNLIKQRVSSKNVQQKESEIERLTLEAINSITKDDWIREVNHVKRIENTYWENERLDDIQEFIIEVGDESESSSSSDDDDSTLGDRYAMSGIETMDEDDD
ncbi:unnamed protein product [Euphydryas editha]|uniref:Tc1-like transposase DDE domain-containing protein n=1 Tax=Euphydryas editha TaxID=104508 RepID=A0AAU9U2Q1_EUPED|nr:unnamed protein product [Euphydryas editha]